MSESYIQEIKNQDGIFVEIQKLLSEIINFFNRENPNRVLILEPGFLISFLGEIKNVLEDQNIPENLKKNLKSLWELLNLLFFFEVQDGWVLPTTQSSFVSETVSLESLLKDISNKLRTTHFLSEETTNELKILDSLYEEIFNTILAVLNIFLLAFQSKPEIFSIKQ